MQELRYLATPVVKTADAHRPPTAICKQAAVLFYCELQATIVIIGITAVPLSRHTRASGYLFENITWNINSLEIPACAGMTIL